MVLSPSSVPARALEVQATQSQISQEMLDIVLEKAAGLLDVPLAQMQREYHCGECLVQEVKPGVFRVSSRSGLWELLLDAYI